MEDEQPFQEVKTGPMHMAQVDTEQGTFDSYPSIFGRVDEYEDKIWPGAYTKTIAERGPAAKDIIRCCWQHLWREPLGRPLVLAEHERDQLPEAILEMYPDAKGGLFAKTKMTVEVARAREALALIRDGVVRRMSIGFDLIKSDFDGEDQQGIRNLREIKLWDYSPVTFAAEEAAMISGVKTVVPYQNLPLASEERAWDAAAARARMAAWAGGPDKDEISWAKYKKGFLYVVSGEESEFGGYKMPIADVIDGSLKAVPRGIFAAASRLGSLQASEEDKAKIRNHLTKYYKRMGRTPPWEERGAEELETDAEQIWSVYRELRAGRALAQSDAEAVQRVITALEEVLEPAEPPLGALTGAAARARVLEAEISLGELRLTELED